MRSMSDSTSRRIALLVQFDGTDFHGWQMQPNLRTVQGTLSECLKQMTGEPVVCNASSRTDAGVHAVGLPVVFSVESTIPVRGFERGLNTLLPKDVSIMAAAEVDDSFDVRRSARGKVYCYRIWNHRNRPALLAQRAWHVPMPLDIQAMEEAAGHLIGEHDFSAFRATSCQAKSTRRHVSQIAIESRSEERLFILVHGNAFLQYMVRIIVGTLVDVGRGFRTSDWARDALNSRSRAQAGPTAPPHGLCLQKVTYAPSPFVYETPAQSVWYGEDD